MKYSGDWSDLKKLDAALSSHPIDTDMKNRLLTYEEMKEMINNQIFGEYGAIAEKCYEE